MISIEMIQVDHINVDSEYQRALDEVRVIRIAKVFKGGAMKAVSLSKRLDGSLWAYDGMHTIEVAKRCGIKFVPAVIVPGDQKKEAEWFLAINGGHSKRVSQRDVQKAGIIAGDPLSKAAQEILDRYGLRISKGGLRAGQTNAIGAIKRYIKSSPQALSNAMHAIHGLWGEEDCAWSGVVLRGMFDIATSRHDFAGVVKECRRKKVTPRRIMDVAAAMQTAAGASGGGPAYAKAAILKLCGIEPL